MSVQAAPPTADGHLNNALANTPKPNPTTQNETTLSVQPYTDRQATGEEKTKQADMSDEMIPEELLFALTQIPYVTTAKKEQLSPIKNVKTPENIRMALRKGPPANVWNYKARRTQFKHLTEHPRSMGKGVGTRDISFLYDIVSQQKPRPPSPSKLDKSAVRLEGLNSDVTASEKLAVPDSIIPDEYHLVKSKAVLGLEYVDERLTTLIKDKEDTLRVFPSLLPTKRFEVVQLLKTLDKMLEQSGVEDEDIEVKGPTQIHNLLELIKKEQTIYDLVFSEVIRQVSVECVERGQLLSKLRLKYADILNRIPRQVKSLHAEVMAQRSLDRRLTEELFRFKSSISFLTQELQTVREHDQQVTFDAELAEAELAKALKESQMNANLVDEYHELYELQRKRLEESVSSLTKERDLWSNAAYSLALKITSKNSLNTAKRLHVSEKAWSKLSNHFTVMLSDYDSDCLTQLQKHVDKWREVMFHFNQDLETADKRTVVLLENLREGIQKWITKFDDSLLSNVSDTRSIKMPPAQTITKLNEFLKQWEEKIGEDSERFAGGLLLNNEEQLTYMSQETEAWTGVAWDIYRRHRNESGESFHLSETMKEVNATLHKLVKQLQIRISGENGVARGMMAMQNAFETWSNKIFVAVNGTEPITEHEWLGLYDRFHEHVALIKDIIEWVGTQQKDEDRQNHLPHTHIAVEDVMNSVQDWMKSTLNQIEAEDGKLMVQVTSIHTSLVHWMVQMLLHVVPDSEVSSNNVPTEPSMLSSCSLDELVNKAKSISEHMSYFTCYYSQCCNDIVMANMEEKKNQGDEDADHEYRDFLRVKREAKEWIRTSEFLLDAVLPTHANLFTDEILNRLKIPEERVTRTKLRDSRPFQRHSKASSATETIQEEEKPKPAAASSMQPAELQILEMVEKSVAESDQEQTKPRQSPESIQIEVLGFDENVRTTQLDDSQRSDGEDLPTPSTSLMQSAYDAIAKMDQIQKQLLTTEIRAQTAEERIIDLQEELTEAYEKIRALEKKSTVDAEEEEDTDKKPAETEENIPSGNVASISTEKPSTPDLAKQRRLSTADVVRRASSSRGSGKKQKTPKKK